MSVSRETNGDRRLRLRTRLPVPAQEAFAWHERPGALERLLPPWQRVRVEERVGTIRDGDRVSLAVRKGPLRWRWVAVHRDYVSGSQFSDEQASGPFAAWSHVHRFLADGQASVLEDDIRYRLPLGAFGELVAGRIVDRELERTFAFRHRRLVHDLERHAGTDRRLRVAITGSSGLIGSALSAFLSSGGHDVVRLVRRPPGPGEARWDPIAGAIDERVLEGLDAVVHLAGEPIAGRWTAGRKAAILDSRVHGTQLLAETLAGLERPPRVLISASAVGIYGSWAGDTPRSESSPHGSDFLARVCEAWEEASRPAQEAGIRVVSLRIGVVLEALLSRILLPFRVGLGGRVGDGRQWLSWIALDDVLGAVLHVLVNESLAGPVNAVAPSPVTNARFAEILGTVLRRPAVLPLPAVVVRLVLGEMGEHVVLGGQRVEPEKLVESGFRFAWPELKGALRYTLGRGSAPEGELVTQASRLV